MNTHAQVELLELLSRSHTDAVRFGSVESDTVEVNVEGFKAMLEELESILTLLKNENVISAKAELFDVLNELNPLVNSFGSTNTIPVKGSVLSH